MAKDTTSPARSSRRTTRCWAMAARAMRASRRTWCRTRPPRTGRATGIVAGWVRGPSMAASRPSPSAPRPCISTRSVSGSSHSCACRGCISLGARRERSHMPPMDIDPADWPDLNRLLDEALDKPAAQRAAWLASLGGEQQAVKARLRELLARKDSVETGEFLETLPKFAGATEAVVSSGSAGDVVGPYRLLRELGSGGMGAVWL